MMTFILGGLLLTCIVTTILAAKNSHYDTPPVIAFISAQLTQSMVVGDTTRSRSTGNTNVMFEAQYLEQAKIASQRWAELRNKIDTYNTNLRKKRAYWDNWFLRLWIAEPPKNLEYIEFSEVMKQSMRSK